jgi:hypothetical protein
LDIWVPVDEKNALKLAEALRQFGFDLPEVNKEIFLKEKKVIRMGVPPMRLEILTSIDGVQFKECFQSRVIADFVDFTANFISKGDLLTNKRASGRPQDMVDCDKLKD